MIRLKDLHCITPEAANLKHTAKDMCYYICYPMCTYHDKEVVFSVIIHFMYLYGLLDAFDR